MSRCEWVIEHIEAYLSAGLEPGERAELESHASSCDPCRIALDRAREADAWLNRVFADARPSADLEDRIMLAVQTAPLSGLEPGRANVPVYLKLAGSLAAVLVLGVTGAIATSMIEGKGFPKFGMGSERATAGAPQSREPMPLMSHPDHPAGGDRPAGGAGWLGDTRDTGLASADEKARQLFSQLNQPRSATESAPSQDGDPAVALIKPTERNLDRVEELDDRLDRRDTEKLGKLLESNSRSRAGGFRSPTSPAAPAPVIPGLAGPAPTDAPAPGKKEVYYAYNNLSDKGNGDDKKGYFQPGLLTGIDPAKQPAAERGEAEGDKSERNKEGLDARAGDPKADPKVEPKAEPMGKDEPEPVVKRMIIRNGDMEFEVESFENAVGQVTKIANEEKGFVGTVNSEKLPNGKVRGIVVVRCPPERLDTLLLKLRALGELKSQRIAAQDVTKQFYDTESRLRAARAMEGRLLEIIKTGKGQIKDLLEAEKQLGEWRTRIEGFEGEIRYLSSLVSLSTLTLTLNEKEIRAAAAAVSTERVNMGIEVEDVEKAYQAALAAIAEAKGRVGRSELKKYEGGQFAAVIECETTAEAAGPLRDRFSQLGRVTRLDVDRRQSVEGRGALPELKVRHEQTKFALSLYNVANIAPRQSTSATLACPNAEETYKAILARVEKAGGRIVNSQINRAKDDQTTATIHFEVRSELADAVFTEIRTGCETVRLTTSENPDNNNTTNAKRGFHLQLLAMGLIAPRETTHAVLACHDAEAVYKAALARIEKAGGRVINAQLVRAKDEQTTGVINFDVRSAEAEAVFADIRVGSELVKMTTTENPDAENSTKIKRGFQVHVLAMGLVGSRETVVTQLAARDVAAGYTAIRDAVAKAKGRMISARLDESNPANITAHLDFEVRREDEAAIDAALAVAGDVFSRNVQRAAEGENVVDSKVRRQVTLLALSRIPPRETVTMSVVVRDFKAAKSAIPAVVSEFKGRLVDQKEAQERSGRDVGRYVIEVPASSTAAASAKLRDLGIVRAQEASRNPQIPDMPSAVGRIEVTISNEDPIVSAEDGLWPQIRKALSTTFAALGYSLMVVIVGVCVILPWVAILYGLWKFATRGRKAEPAVVIATAPATTPSTGT